MKKFIIMVLTVLFGLTNVSAQKTVVAKKAVTKQQVFSIDQMPEFPGGQAALSEFLMKNVKYPADAKEKKIEGRVLVTFMVDTDGSITDIGLLKKTYPSLDTEAKRVIKAMPKWIPGKHNGKVVKVHYSVPITFRLK